MYTKRIHFIGGVVLPKLPVKLTLPAQIGIFDTACPKNFEHMKRIFEGKEYR